MGHGRRQLSADPLGGGKRGALLPDKFEPVEVHAEPCTDADRDTHLRAFVAGFVTKARRGRCLHILLEAPQKARRELHELVRWLDPDLVRRLQGSAAFPQRLASSLGQRRGVYFDESGSCCLLTPAQAVTRATLEASDAVLSLTPGKRALVFHHEEGVFLCERP